MPSFIRLIGGEEAATALIKGFIECIGSKNDGLEAPKELVDDVLDAIGLFLLKLNMDKYTKQILLVVEKFAPNLMKPMMVIIEASKEVQLVKKNI